MLIQVKPRSLALPCPTQSSALSLTYSSFMCFMHYQCCDTPLKFGPQCRTIINMITSNFPWAMWLTFPILSSWHFVTSCPNILIATWQSQSQIHPNTLYLSANENNFTLSPTTSNKTQCPHTITSPHFAQVSWRKSARGWGDMADLGRSVDICRQSSDYAS